MGGHRSSIQFQCALALALATVGGGAFAQSIPTTGVSGNAAISYSADGIPTVIADNENDAAFAMGYAHARDRFFQMDFTRRAASGTLAELVGIAALANDVQIRTLGMRRAAWESYVRISPDTRGWLQSYADGVNVWLNTNSLPPEYAGLELSGADPWTPVDSLVIGKILSFQLSFDLDIDLTIRLGAYMQAGQAGGFNGAALFFEDTHRIQPPDGRVSIPNFLDRIGGQGAMSAKSVADGIGNIDAQTLELAIDYRQKIAGHPLIGPTLKPREGRGGSNWWVVGGEHTASGRPILANDPHLSLDLPSLFQTGMVHHSAGTPGGAVTASGAVVPGSPMVLLGCNPSICWGLTTNPLDVTDTFREDLRLNGYGLPTHTVHNGVAEPVKWVLQSYFVNRIGDEVIDNVTREESIGYTNGGVTVIVPRRNNGPIVNISGNVGLSVAYTGWGATRELEAVRRINKARNLEEFQHALTYFDVGSQNFAYADVAGNIAYFTSAEAPIRTDLQTRNAPGGGVPPFLIRDGSGALEHDWLPVQNPQINQATPFEILPPNEMPHVVNPGSGYIVNANNDPVGTTLDNNPLNQLRPGGGLYYLNAGYSSYRVGRIDRLMRELFARGDLTLDDIRATQANNQALDAELMLPHLEAAITSCIAPNLGIHCDLVSPRVIEAFGYLLGWDYSTPTGIAEGFDAGDNPFALPEPSVSEIEASVAATLFAIWRSMAVQSIMDGSLRRVGLGDHLPGSGDAWNGLKHLLDNFETGQGVGASGIDFFAVPGLNPEFTAENRRDWLLIKALVDGMDLLASDAFAPAFANSTNLSDYRWGRLHRIEFRHPLGGPFNIPGPGLYGLTNLSPELPGLARPGGYEVLDVASHNIRADGVNEFMFDSGPARRFLGEMFDDIVALQAIPGGQSGTLGSPLYISQLPLWLTNAYAPLAITVEDAEAAEASRIEFVPAR